VTLHHLMDTIDLDDAGVRCPRFYQLAGRWRPNASPGEFPFRPGIRPTASTAEKYGSTMFISGHGIFTQYPERRTFPGAAIPITGSWHWKMGPIERLEPICEAFRLVADRIPK